MRKTGLSLAEIREYLAHRSPAAALNLFEKKIHVLQNQIDDLQRQKEVLSRYVENIKNDQPRIPSIRLTRNAKEPVILGPFFEDREERYENIAAFATGSFALSQPSVNHIGKIYSKTTMMELGRYDDLRADRFYINSSTGNEFKQGGCFWKCMH